MKKLIFILSCWSLAALIIVNSDSLGTSGDVLHMFSLLLLITPLIVSSVHTHGGGGGGGGGGWSDSDGGGDGGGGE